MDREFLGAHEEHMLKEVSKTERAIWVLKAADADRDGAGAFLESGIFNKKDLDAIVEGESLIFSGVVGRFGWYDRDVGRILDLHSLKSKDIWFDSTL